MEGTWHTFKDQAQDGVAGLFNDDGQLLARIEKIEGLFQVEIPGNTYYDPRFLTEEQAKIWVNRFKISGLEVNLAPL